MIKVKRYKREQPTIKNPDRICIICSKPYKAVAPKQKTCSLECRVKYYSSLTKNFHERNPDAMKQYNKNRVAKNPNVWKDKSKAERNEIISKLGGRCCVPKCATRNPLHFHIDYKPTMRGTGLRHPRHKRWVLDNIKKFRLICANHHYELTITGKIEGTKIVQPKKL